MPYPRKAPEKGGILLSMYYWDFPNCHTCWFIVVDFVARLCLVVLCYLLRIKGYVDMKCL